MTSSKKTVALALTGAVALASGAYALGSQAGDGDASAARSSNSTQPAAPPYGGPPGRWHGPRPDLSGLADRLGVDEADLRAALEDIRADRPDPQKLRDDFAKELADALGIDVAKVTAALDKLRPTRGDCSRERGPATAALAKALGVTQAQLRAAFEKVRAAKEKEFADRRDAFAEALAKRLGLDASKVKKALETPGLFGGRPGP